MRCSTPAAASNAKSVARAVRTLARVSSRPARCCSVSTPLETNACCVASEVPVSLKRNSRSESAAATAVRRS
eukprot:10333471-Lingulodinium_polyedra.AAC.1